MKSELTPKEIVQQLDKYIVGQKEAKKAVAIAIRNRWRRLQLDAETQKDIIPKNIIMIGPTGVGKTEIARRIAQLINAPFIKVEATKYTEVGYHGRDVESMIRDLMKVAFEQVFGGGGHAVVCGVGVVDARLHVKAKVRRGALVACVGGDHGKATVQRVPWCGLWAHGRAHHAVVATTALVQQPAVPLRG